MPNTRSPDVPPQRRWRYLPPDPVALACGLAVTGAGWSHIPPGSPYPPGGHPQTYQFAWERGRILHEFQLIYLTRGSGIFESSASGTHTLAGGDLIALVPGTWHRYLPAPATGWDEHWVSFRGENARHWLEHRMLDAASPVSHLGLRPELVLGFRAIADFMTHQPAGFSQLASAHVGLLVAQIQAAIRASDESPLAEAVRNACAQLAEQPRAPLRITRLAADLGVSERSLRRAFIAHTGLSPKRWLLALRLTEAERLLSHGVMVGEVAQACGFSCRSFFSRRFRARYGHSPAQTHRQTTASHT